MPRFQYDFDPADHFTTGTIGEPGQRTFFLQAGQGIEYVSMICEKEQMRALGEGLLSLLDQIAEVFHKPVPEDRSGFNFDLVEPIIPIWRISQLGVGYDEERDRIVIIVQELVDEDAGVDAEVGRFTITREHANAFAYHALEVVAAGRPTCPFCGEPIDPEGHFCSRTNGHDKSYVQ
ncbi:MAG: DUF3090 domain-containing protein [Caldilineae bacterium]|nr:MAG: DUF3090 domain-containing protein [Caldilineae bacterium]